MYTHNKTQIVSCSFKDTVMDKRRSKAPIQLYTALLYTADHTCVCKQNWVLHVRTYRGERKMLDYILYVLGSVVWWCGRRGEDDISPASLRATVLGELLPGEVETILLLLFGPLGPIVLFLGGVRIGREEHGAPLWEVHESDG